MAQGSTAFCPVSAAIGAPPPELEDHDRYLGPLAFRCLSLYDYPWEVFCRVMRGDRSCEEIKKRCRPDILFRQLLVKSARNQPIA